jgi:hypothetical protein
MKVIRVKHGPVVIVVIVVTVLGLNYVKKSEKNGDKMADSAESWQKVNWRCDKCFPFNYSLTITSPAICQKGEIVELVILISTTILHSDRRRALRKTWLSVTHENTGHIRYAFLLGAVNDTKLQAKIKLENDLYNDIVQGDYPDSYYTLTLKTLSGFHWVAIYCSDTSYVMKTDDDVFINIPNLMETVHSFKDDFKTSIGGRCYERELPVINKSSKYFTSYEQYPYEHFFGFCSGTGYVTSIHVIKQVLNVSENVPFFHLEDVYVGFCAEQLGLSLQHIEGFYADAEDEDLCAYKSKTPVVLHNSLRIPNFVFKMWSELSPCKNGILQMFISFLKSFF